MAVIVLFAEEEAKVVGKIISPATSGGGRRWFIRKERSALEKRMGGKRRRWGRTCRK